MVSWDYECCNGSGMEEVIVIRNGSIKSYTDDCSNCKGSGHMRNGEPEYVHVRWE